ncbi:hypothetical protein FN846DRAFT_907452 [Sphaerosporella brunnea]|uniref:Uncharacterized protein n=1 Tax=Sphaerosporella brunnea TaxID=1250544 RepID=A0A5J5EW59_9PEZI|nr:hypothetical protein FN846DRAFT_907452 [Sphaerosporella brunnea]
MAFDDILGKSWELIRDLVKKNKSDRWYFEKAIQILLGTLIWIVVRRLFWGPIWLLVVWPLKTIWWIYASVLDGDKLDEPGNGDTHSDHVKL